MADQRNNHNNNYDYYQGDRRGNGWNHNGGWDFRWASDGFPYGNWGYRSGMGSAGHHGSGAGSWWFESGAGGSHDGVGGGSGFGFGWGGSSYGRHGGGAGFGFGFGGDRTGGGGWNWNGGFGFDGGFRGRDQRGFGSGGAR